jgi:transcriptional regulator with XRE-family HTH domain
MRIKELIKEKGLTVAEVASKMGIKAPTLSRTINGNPTVETLMNLARAIQVDVRELFSDPSKDLFGLVEYKGHLYKIYSVDGLKQLLLQIETDKSNNENTDK